MITQVELKKLVHYDPLTGLFKWLVSKGNVKAGGKCGWVDGGYLRTKINRKHYRLHRLSWLYMTGGWPDQIDHKDHDGHNNIFSNLRDATILENAKNHSQQKNNTSNVTGVNFHKPNGKWRAYVYVSKVQISLGYFVDKFEAICARKSAERKYNFYENHGQAL